MSEVEQEIHKRALFHDDSKFEEPEVSGFMAMADELRLADTEYDSAEYRAILKKYHDSTVGHHYAVNDHHPEHFQGGIAEMSLISLIEMLCDWKAATLRMKNGDLKTSIEKNQARFGYSDELKRILINTADDLGMFE